MERESPRYLIPESTFHRDHPEVTFWTEYFFSAAQKKNVFANYHSALAGTSDRLSAASCVASAWENFTRFVPKFICKAVVRMPQPEWQHHVIQIAYEELGGRLKKNIHSKLFCDALAAAAVPCSTAKMDDIVSALGWFDRCLDEASGQQAIFGLLLSFEIIAEQNIEALCDGLSFSPEARASFDQSSFFRIHRADESEHIRHSIANFLRFCQTDADKLAFREAFDGGIVCWQFFWDQMARTLNLVHGDGSATEKAA